MTFQLKKNYGQKGTCILYTTLSKQICLGATWFVWTENSQCGLNLIRMFAIKRMCSRKTLKL